MGGGRGMGRGRGEGGGGGGKGEGGGGREYGVRTPCTLPLYPALWYVCGE